MIYTPVKDHCHLTGKFRSVLCNDCNLKRQNQKYLPVVIHGSSNYDSHFIVRQIGCDKERITITPNTNEKYIAFTKSTVSGIKLQVKDSFRFLQTSLSKLANNLTTPQFAETQKFFTFDKLPLVTTKVVYPYSYSWDKLNETKFPQKIHFNNKMLLEHISD